MSQIGSALTGGAMSLLGAAYASQVPLILGGSFVLNWEMINQFWPMVDSATALGSYVATMASALNQWLAGNSLMNEFSSDEMWDEAKWWWEIRNEMADMIRLAQEGAFQQNSHEAAALMTELTRAIYLANGNDIVLFEELEEAIWRMARFTNVWTEIPVWRPNPVA